MKMTDERKRCLNSQTIQINGVPTRTFKTLPDGYPPMRKILEQWKKEADEPFGFHYWMIDDYRDLLEYAGLNRERLSE